MEGRILIFEYLLYHDLVIIVPISHDKTEVGNIYLLGHLFG